MYRVVLILLVVQLINLLIGGAHGAPTVARIARAHRVYARAPMSPAVRALVDVTARTQHNLAFVAPMLSPQDTIDLSASLALPVPVFGMPVHIANAQGDMRIDTSTSRCVC